MIREDNIIIAEFMGSTIRGETVTAIDKYPTGKEGWEYESINYLRFHDSWDWLVPVVNKIASVINENNFDSYNNWEEYYIAFNELSFLDISLDSLYNDVVLFVKWYYKEKQ